jgi:hypothetical protein
MANLLAGSALLLALSLAADQGPSYSVTAGPVREAGGMQREVTLEVRREGAEVPRRLAFTVPREVVRLDERPGHRIVDGKLLAYTPGVFAVFDLATGQLDLSRVVMPDLSPTEDGRRLAYKQLQPRFLPAEATSTVISVLDVATLVDQPVFPESGKVDRSRSGHLLVWEDDPAKRCSAGKLFWSPGGDRLLFFCKPEVGELSLVLVDLRGGLKESRFAQRPVARELYLEPGAAARSSETYFQAERVTWLEGNRIQVEPSPEASWIQDRILLDLPRAD